MSNTSIFSIKSIIPRFESLSSPVIQKHIGVNAYRQFGFITNGLAHYGSDIDLEKDAPVFSVSTGIVKLVDNNHRGLGGSAGQTGGVCMIESIVNGKTYVFVYIHCKFSVKVGDLVTAGKQIGVVHDYIAPDGISNWRHLHFGIYIGSFPTTSTWGYGKLLNKWLNPMDFFSLIRR